MEDYDRAEYLLPARGSAESAPRGPPSSAMGPHGSSSWPQGSAVGTRGSAVGTHGSPVRHLTCALYYTPRLVG